MDDIDEAEAFHSDPKPKGEEKQHNTHGTANEPKGMKILPPAALGPQHLPMQEEN